MKKLHAILWFLMLIVCIIISNTGYCQTIRHKAYTVYYNPAIKAPDSCSWNLNPLMVSCGNVTRVDMFAQDPMLKNGPKPDDFANTTKDKSQWIDKGHLMSFKSSACDPQTIKECFYVDQMYAQYHGFNNGDWKIIEEYEQTLAKTKTIHVIAGYIKRTTAPEIRLKAGEIVPSFMYKAILHDGAYECWIAPNLPITHGHDVKFWHVTVAELNSRTGLHLK